jgi:hypothetical protein
MIILDKYIAINCYNLILTVREKGQDRPQLYIINITYTVYMPLHYMLLFLYSDLN